MGVIKPMQAVNVEWGLMALAVPLVGARCYFAITRKGRLMWSDWFVIAAWVMFAFQTAADYTMRRYYIGGSQVHVVQAGDTLGSVVAGHNWEETILIAKMKYAENVTYYSCMYFVKFSWLCFFQDLLPRTLPILRKVYWVVTVVTVIGWIYTTLVEAVYCWPVSRHWAVKPGEPFCANADWTWISIMTIHSITDGVIYILPILMLRTVHSLSVKNRFAVAAIFSLGFICVAWAIIMQVENLYSVPGSVVCVTGAFEQFWAVFVVCLPAIKSLLAGRVPVLAKSAWTSVSASRGFSTTAKSYNVSNIDPTATTASRRDWTKEEIISTTRSVDQDQECGSSSKGLVRDETTEIDMRNMRMADQC